MDIEDKNSNKNKVHKILARSYAVHFILFLVGIIFDILFSVKVFTSPVFIFFGFVFMVFGSILIFWAQYTSRNLKKENITKETFSRGPYHFTRTPTNFGLFFVVLGFGLILSAFFVVLSSFVSFIVAKFVFLNKEEEVLAQKYGAPYLEYKKSVKF